MRKTILTENPSGAALHPSLNTVKWTLFSKNTAIRTLLTVALATLNLVLSDYRNFWNNNR